MNESKLSSAAATDPIAFLAGLPRHKHIGRVFLDSSRGNVAGTSYLAWNPREILTETDEGWFASGRRVDPFEWLMAAPDRFPFVCGALSFEAAWMLDDIHQPHRDTGTPRLWAAGYDEVEVFTERTPSPTLPLSNRGLRVPDAEAYRMDVARCIREIYAGELFEINYTARYSGETQMDGLALYEAARHTSTGSYFAYMDAGDFELISLSPEQFITVNGTTINTRPIKGTRRRGATPDEDFALIDELRNSAKDRAENVMIVDLMRNDLSRVCTPGSVQAPHLFDIETFAGVHHLVSTVTGELDPRISSMEAFLACFPAGSITGAPKLRSIELIAEIERQPRGYYTGSIFRSHEGSFDSSVLIRTIEKRGSNITYGSGGAVVADSSPTSEHDEANLKAQLFTRLFE